MSRAVGTFEHRREIQFPDAKPVCVGIQIGRRRKKHEIRVLRLQRVDVRVEGSWITCEVAGVVELCRVQKDADEGAIVFGPTASYERQMPLVKCPHRRDEPERHTSSNLRQTFCPPGRYLVKCSNHE